VGAAPGKRLALWREILGRLEGDPRSAPFFDGGGCRVRRPEHFDALVEGLDALTVEGDALGALYEGVLERAAADRKSGAGQYFTPRPLVAALVACLKPGGAERVLDPACGTGGFLLAAAAAGAGAGGLKGVELVDEVCRLARMNAWLRGVDALILQGDGLADAGGADVIFCNPPFGRRRPLAFLQRVINGLAEGGRAAVIVPDGLLFEGGAVAAARAEMMARCEVHTLLRLPAGIFYAPSVRANALFFNRGRPTRALWVYDLRGGGPRSRRRPLTRADLADFEAAYGADPAGRSARVESPRFRPFERAALRARGDDLDLDWAGDYAPPPDAEGLLEAAISDLTDAARSLAALRELLP